MLLSDKQILDLCAGDTPMMSPVFTAKQNKTEQDAKVPSYGPSSYGYDIRIRPGTVVKTALERFGGLLDPLNADEHNWTDLRTRTDHEGRRYVILPANTVALAVAEPHFQMPADILGVVQGKSTYARNAVIPLVTPLEPGWRGDLTLEFTNMAPIPSVLYLDGGIAQILFFRGGEVAATYQGNYQDQSGITLGQVK